MNKPLTLGSLFDGSGGFPLGAVLHGIRPIWASEIEPFAGALAARGIRFETYFAVGAIPEAVAGFVSSTGCRALVVAREHASRGRGSTLRRLARLVDVPIVLA